MASGKYLTIDASDFDPKKLHMKQMESKKFNDESTYLSGSLVYDGYEHWSVIEPVSYCYKLVIQKTSGKRGLLTRMSIDSDNYKFRTALSDRIKELAVEQAGVIKKKPDMIRNLFSELINPPDEEKGYTDPSTFVNIKDFTRFFKPTKDGKLIDPTKGETGDEMTDSEVANVLKCRFTYIPKTHVTYLYVNGNYVSPQLYATEITVLNIEKFNRTQTVTPKLSEALVKFYMENPDAIKTMLEDLQASIAEKKKDANNEEPPNEEVKTDLPPEVVVDIPPPDEKPATKTYAGKTFQSLKKK